MDHLLKKCSLTYDDTITSVCPEIDRFSSTGPECPEPPATGGRRQSQIHTVKRTGRTLLVLPFFPPLGQAHGRDHGGLGRDTIVFGVELGVGAVEGVLEAQPQ